MLDEVVEAAVARLKDLFPNCGVFKAFDNGSGEEPHFLVGFTEVSERRLSGRRYARQSGLQIRYFPGFTETTSPERESLTWNQVVDVLMDGMEYITLPDGGPIRGAGCRAQIKDGILEFCVNYDMTVVKPEEPEDTMEKMVLEGGIVHEGRKKSR